MAAVVAQDVQMLSIHPGQQARELQPSLPVPLAATPPLETQSESDRRMRCRVVWISCLIAVYVIVNALLRCMFDLAAVEDMLAKVREVTHFDGGPTAMSMVFQTAPSVISSIGIGLLVPLCGYLGVKQNQKWLMCAFCGCNAFYCCTAILGMIGLGCFLVMIQAMAPSVELFLERCDPMQCQHNMLYKGGGNTSAHMVDCLASGVWKDYKTHFDDTMRFPRNCPPMFLKCDNFNLQKNLQNMYGDEAEESEMVAPRTESEMGHDAPVAMGDYGGFLSNEVPSSTRGYASESGLHDSLRRLSSTFSKQHEKNEQWKQMLHGEGSAFVPPPMPKDPINECSPAKTVTQFHEVRILVPELLPKLKLFMLVKALLLIPVFIFGCLGFCWGKDLWSRLSDGYNPVDSQTRPQVMLQPALGQSGAPGSTQMQMAQPLMLNMPPTPQALVPQPQQPQVMSISPPQATTPSS